MVAIGDHAHGQGANLALADSLALADTLADAGARAPPAATDARRAVVSTALRAYTRARRARTHFHQLQAPPPPVGLGRGVGGKGPRFLALSRALPPQL